MRRGYGSCRCAREAVYSADSPRSKPSSTASTLWKLALVTDDNWEADFGGGDEWISDVFEEDEREVWTSLYFFLFLSPVCKRNVVIC
jgi:hypothetical protein